ncbi:MAG: accessory factor UbiK family protein [Woeseia sp.]
MATESIEKLARRLAQSLPEGLKAARDDVEQNFRSVLRSGLSRMDLVTREEFDVQEAVLARTREKLDGLEQRLKLLEAAPGRKKVKKKKRPAGETASKKKEPDR